MFTVLHNRNNHYNSSLLCFIIVCILVVCTANARPELEKLSYAGSNNVSSIASPEHGFYEIISDGLIRYSVIKSIVSKKSAAGKTSVSKGKLTCAVTGASLILIGICVLFLLYFYRDLATSHHFIITYIHNLDGMKP